MKIEDSIRIERVVNGYKASLTSKIEETKYDYKTDDYVFVTFDEVIEWIKLQK